MQTVEPGGRLYISVEPITTFYRAEEHHQEAIRKSRAKLAAQARAHQKEREEKL